ncbi:uncharacterized protein PFL1_06487 [Pseudozyma flocculosa PF-1]|uniref:Uncharacterized protein n=2 Tax=Pseudozyma flocculosa TaxID=84751 RepID=A0A5C3ETP9_9BASI|nr:uncharacterized protein PFL1_06487 [Pseudozyma flocculosa PF-1]EPQ26034.1 hypothetical protein PFL1_06487 [Pseudozyma flocculosa PF-1]SPO35658.1 uncharacterized protein PSFLO_01129 [Pseudozyma flocculosa]
MGQSQSASYHPSAVGSHNFEAVLPSDHDPKHQSSSQRLNVPRSLAESGIPRHNYRSSSPSSNYQPLIPRELRRSGAGPIRHRPTPPEYAAAGELSDQGGRAWPASPTEDDYAAAQKRRSVRRISATPRDPPLLEESESVRDHESVISAAAEPIESDHGHAPTPISPSLALALKAGLGSGSLRLTTEGQLAVQTDADTSGEDVGLGIGEISYQDDTLREPVLAATIQDAGTSAEKGRAHLLSFWERRPSTETAPADEEPVEDMETLDRDVDATPRGLDAEARWQSDWEDRRQYSSNASSDPSPEKRRDAAPGLTQPASRFSLSSYELSHQQDLQSGESDRDAFGPRSRFSYTTTDSSGSYGQKDQARNSIETNPDLRPIRSSDERAQRSQAEPGSSSGANRTHLTAHHPTREQSQSTMYSAAAPSSDFEPPRSSQGGDADERTAVSPDPYEYAALVTASTRAAEPESGVTATSDDDSRSDPRSFAPPSTGDANGSDHAQPAAGSVGRRPRAFSLMDLLRGRGRRPSDASQPSMSLESSSPLVLAENASTDADRNASRPRQLGPSSPSVLRDLATDLTPKLGTMQMPRDPDRASLATAKPSLHGRQRSAGGASDHGERRAPGSRTGSVYSASTLRSRRSSTMSLRAKNSQQAQGKKRLAGAAMLPWWKQSSLKRKVSASPPEDSRGKSLRIAARKQPAAKVSADEDHWVDVDEAEARAAAVVVNHGGVEGLQNTQATASRAARQASSAWPWARRYDQQKPPTEVRAASEPVERSVPASPHAAAPISVSGSDRGRVSPALEVPIAIVSRDPSVTGIPTANNSSASSFSSLAPPKPPAPVPPLRRPRRPSRRQSLHTEDGAAGSEASTASGVSGAAQIGAIAGRSRQDSRTSPNPSEAASTCGFTETSGADTYNARQSTPGTSLADAVSHKASQRPLPELTLEKGMGSQTVYIAGPGGFAPAVSPLSPAFTDVLSSDGVQSRVGSDSGTKEVLLSDKESDADRDAQYPSRLPDASKTPKTPTVVMQDEQHPDVHVLVPGSGSFSRNIQISGMPAAFAAERTYEPRAFSRSASLDAASPLPSTGDSRFHNRSGTDGISFHPATGSLDESFGSPRMPLGRRGSTDSRPAPRREPSGPAESFVTARSRDTSEAQDFGGIDSAYQTRYTVRPEELAGLYSGSTEEQHPAQIGSHRSSRSRPLPQIPEPHGQAERRNSAGPSESGPPLSPSAVYPGMGHGIKLDGRQSWSSSDGPWSAEVVSQSQALAPARGLAVAQQASLGRQAAHASHLDALLSPGNADSRVGRPLPAQLAGVMEASIEDRSSLLARQSSSGSTSGGSGKAPFADTGVQASLAALKALESPGSDPRTFWARQRILGERDTSAQASTFNGDPPTNEASDELLGSRQRRRMDPYSTARSLRSSDGFSSSGSRQVRRRRNTDTSRVSRGDRRHVWDQTGMAEMSSASLADTSGAASDSDVAGSLLARKLQAQRRRMASQRKASPFLREQGRSRTMAIELNGSEEVAEQQTDRLAHATSPRTNAQHPLREGLPQVEVTSPFAQAGLRIHDVQDRSASNEWDETIVPAVRKRMEREAQAAAAKSTTMPYSTSPSTATAVSPSFSPGRLRKHEYLPATGSRASHIPFPSEASAPQGSYLEVDPYSLAKADREAYRRALERQLQELERAERDSAPRSRRPTEAPASHGAEKVVRAKSRSRTHRNSEGSRSHSQSHSHVRRGDPANAYGKRDSTPSHHYPREKAAGSEAAHHTAAGAAAAESRKASSTSRSKGKGRRPSKQGYTGDDIRAWLGMDLANGPPPDSLAEPALRGVVA